MAYDEFLAERIQRIYEEKRIPLLAKKMFGGGARPMDFSGKSMKGFLYIDSANIDMDEDLEYWINLALEYNPRAKSSKK